MPEQITIYGGGVAGATLARKLSEKADVTLVSPLDYFEVPMAMPRNLVAPSFADHSAIPFAEALKGVRHIRGTLKEMTPQGGLVETVDGQSVSLPMGISVLATGSRYANELVRPQEGTVSDRRAMFRDASARIAEARNILIVGGGAIGIEIAGEISETHPDKQVTVIEGGDRILNGTSLKVAEHAERVLAGRGVTIIKGERLEEPGLPATGLFESAGVARTGASRTIPYDLLLWAIGGRPITGYMQAHYGHVLDPRGRVQVGPDLRVRGEERLFALGDITDLNEAKKAIYTGKHVEVAATNIGRLMADPNARLKSYTAQTGDNLMLVTLGSQAGVAHLPLFGLVKAGWFIRMAKASRMLVPRYRKAVGALAAAF